MNLIIKQQKITNGPFGCKLIYITALHDSQIRFSSKSCLSKVNINLMNLNSTSVAVLFLITEVAIFPNSHPYHFTPLEPGSPYDHTKNTVPLKSLWEGFNTVILNAGGGVGTPYNLFWVGVCRWDSETLTPYQTMFS